MEYSARMRSTGRTSNRSVESLVGEVDTCPRATPGYIHSPQGGIYTWHHWAKPNQQRDLTLIVCSPMGYEYTHSHRSLKFLADTAANAGLPVFRFDFHGVGDSPGNECENNKLDLWLAEITALIKQAKHHYPNNKICLLGLRFGASLAWLATLKTPVDELVLWEPIVKGKRYIRELVAVSRLSATASDQNLPYIESAGFLMSEATASAIKKINLLHHQPSVTGSVYCLFRETTAAGEELLQLLHHADIRVNSDELPGFTDMMAEPQDTVLPEQAVDTTIRWLQSRSHEEAKLPSPQTQCTASQPNFTSSIVFDKSKDSSGDGRETRTEFIAIKESVCWYSPEQQLFGVLCCPATGSDTNKPLVILANSGSVHHVGPNRVYTHIARQLAACGVSSLRIDIQGIGESCALNSSNKNHPYQDSAVSDVFSAIHYVIDQGLASTVTLAGICSGAYSAFHSALAQNTHKLPIAEIILINPLTFYWRDDMPLDIPSIYQTVKDSKHYAKSLRSLASWKKLISGKASVGYITSFVGRRLAERLRQGVAETTEWFSGSKSELATDLQTIIDQSIHIVFVFASTDPGLDIVNLEAKRTFQRGLRSGAVELCVIDGADHTFSKTAKREALYQFFRNNYQQGMS